MTEDISREKPDAGELDGRAPKPAAVGVSFGRGSKVYYFRPNGAEVAPGDHVLVHTEKGVDIAEVVKLVLDSAELDNEAGLKPVVRKASADDLEYEQQLHQREKMALRTCERKIAEYGLPMKLIDADYTFDRRCLVFFFSSDGRVDFRELVRELAKIFKTRIELRQIGVRDEAKMLGGVGPCGRPLCCQTFLRSFEPVGIKVAKDQGLSLNPTKISGVCDRLMCCLRYEQELYQELRSQMPAEGQIVDTPQGRGEVVEVQVLANEVVVQIDDETRITVATSEVKHQRRSRQRRARH